MEQFLAPLLDMLRATPWVVWAVGLPAVIALRNRGLALAERFCPNKHCGQVFMVLLTTLAGCATITGGTLLAHRYLAA